MSRYYLTPIDYCKCQMEGGGLFADELTMLMMARRLFAPATCQLTRRRPLPRPPLTTMPEVLCTAGTRFFTSSRAVSSAVSAASDATVVTVRSRRSGWKKYLWRAIWVPYAILTGIPVTSSALGAYYYLRGDGERARGCAFFAVTGFLSLPLSVPMFLAAPYILIADRDKRTFADMIQKTWGRTTTRLFFETKVEGLERISHLEGKGAVYVSNHQSWLDIYALFWVDPLALKIVSKKEIMMIPLCGWLMYLIGHIPFDRRKGGRDLLRQCEDMLDGDAPVFFFPEGTRSRDGKLGKFKAGAFVLATRKQVPVVPITILGTRRLMPPGNEFWEGGSLSADGNVRVIVHDPIYPKQISREQMEGWSSGVLATDAVQRLSDEVFEAIAGPLKAGSRDDDAA